MDIEMGNFEKTFRLFVSLWWQQSCKLEYLLSDVLRSGAKHVITSGAAGSNHACATATYAACARLKTTLMLFDQMPSPIVQENLLADYFINAELFFETYKSHYQHLQDKIKGIGQPGFFFHLESLFFLLLGVVCHIFSFRLLGVNVKIIDYLYTEYKLH